MTTLLTLPERVEHYRASRFGQLYPASIPYIAADGRLYVHWLTGNNYKNKTILYGAYPPAYLSRMAAIFPEDVPTMHLFAGSLPPGPYVRVDKMRDALRDPDIQCDVYDLSQRFTPRQFLRVYADPPYSQADAERYGSGKLPSPRKVFAELAQIVAPGGHVIWMDTSHPMCKSAANNKDRQWKLVGLITIVRSSNQRYRTVSIWERV